MQSSTTYDADFTTIKELSWLPWVGSNYGSKVKLLLIGESHYYRENQKGLYEKDQNSTREAIEESAIEEYWKVNTYKNLNKLLSGTDKGNNKQVWSKVSYTNICQRILAVGERPNHLDYIEGWKVIFKVMNILKPDVCISIGVESYNHLEYFINSPLVKIEYLRKDLNISGTYAREAKIVLDKEIKMIGIKHTSKYFAWEPWYEYLNRKLDNILTKIV
ncbi:MAG TPA: hypothetical protein P5082_11820 [Treponema sp.]|jgi:hypothetical protein|nr:hypothetical protein [Treponema sp.]